MITARVQTTVHIRTAQTQVQEATTATHHQAVVHQVVQVVQVVQVAVAQARRVIVAHQAAQAVREQVQQL